MGSLFRGLGGHFCWFRLVVGLVLVWFGFLVGLVFSWISLSVWFLLLVGCLVFSTRVVTHALL